MYFLYATESVPDTEDEIPYEKREWWFLRFKHQNKQTVLEWHNKYKREGVRYKLLCTDRNVKESFYPRKEMKSRTATGKMLRNLL